MKSMAPIQERKARSGFTLIELLCVIAIIAILSAMLMPTFARVRELGRRTACQSNLKQLGVAFSMYINDNDGRYPGAGQVQKWADGGHWVQGPCDNTNPAGDPVSCLLARADTQVATGTYKANIEGGAIFSYIKNSQVYICPSISDGQTKGLTYSMNCAIGGIGEPQIQDSTNIDLLIDENKANDGFFYIANSPNSTDALTTVHNGGGNLLLTDGHVKFYTTELDDQPPGLTNKTSLTNTPRFFDSGFGTNGYYAGVPAFGSCASP